MAKGRHAGPGRRALRAVVVVTLAAAVMMLVFRVYGCRASVRAAVGGGYSHWEEFPLRDSLPALEGGLSNLEAFKATMSPFRKADGERAIWLSDTLGAVRLEYAGDKHPFDSVLMLSWATGEALVSRVFHARDVAWSPLTPRRVSGWLEVVAAYVSFPPVISFRMVDPLVSMFEPAEGKVFHVVKDRYFNRPEHPLIPDTTYAVGNLETDLQLVVRGDALAVINPSPRVVVLGLVGGDGRVTVVRGEPGCVSIHRTVMRGRVPPVLAFSDPGRTFPVFRERDAAPHRIFVWMPSARE